MNRFIIQGRAVRRRLSSVCFFDWSKCVQYLTDLNGELLYLLSCPGRLLFLLCHLYAYIQQLRQQSNKFWCHFHFGYPLFLYSV